MKPQRSRADLIFERIPPLISWILITMPFWGGFFFPEFTAGIVIFFNIYFLYKSFTLTCFIILSYLKIRTAEGINWLTRLEEYDNIPQAEKLLQEKIALITKEEYSKEISRLHDNEKLNQIIKKRLPKYFQQLLFKAAKNKVLKFLNSEVTRLAAAAKNPPQLNWHEVKHVIIIPHVNEPFGVLEDTVKRLLEINYPHSSLFVVMAAEARDEDGIKKSRKLEALYGDKFGGFWITEHVMQPGDLVGKSSNMSFSSKDVFQRIQALNWDLQKVTVTSCDADSQLSADYFANLTYLFINDPDRIYKYYTGAVMLYANIWKLPFFARVKNSMSTIYNVGRLIRTDKLIPFSTYTTSFWMIKEIGFWSADIVPEDFHTFFKGLFIYPEKVATVPIFQRILSDSAEGEGNLDTLKNNYFQERRWAWGISDDGWILKNLVKQVLSGKATIRMLYIGLHIIFDHISSVGLALLVSLGGTIPLMINPRFAYTILGFNLPIVSGLIVRITLIFLLIMVAFDSFLKPEMNEKPSLFKRLLLVLEWLVQPATGLLMVTLPGFEAHTRLLFGRYLEYYLTKKK